MQSDCWRLCHTSMLSATTVTQLDNCCMHHAELPCSHAYFIVKPHLMAQLCTASCTWCGAAVELALQGCARPFNFCSHWNPDCFAASWCHMQGLAPFGADLAVLVHNVGLEGSSPRPPKQHSQGSCRHFWGHVINSCWSQHRSSA